MKSSAWLYLLNDKPGSGAKREKSFFYLPSDYMHYTRDRFFEVKEINLDLSLTLSERHLAGCATLTLSSITNGLSEVELDAAGMEISEVLIQSESCNKSLGYKHNNQKLLVTLPDSYKAGENFTLKIMYNTTAPLRGLYFYTSGDEKKSPTQMWSEGLFENSKWWFPCYDAPNQKASFALDISVEDGFLAVSNGELAKVSKDKESNRVTYHWREKVPLPVYLLALIVGKFSVVERKHGNIPLLYYVPEGKEKEAELAFGRTDQMMTCYEKLIGLPYPYEKYGQITAKDYFTGAMEHASLSTFDEGFLVDERAAIDYPIDFLVAHELAHQWWGDLITCRSWGHAWLSEGFATYFEALYRRESKGKDEFEYYLYEIRKKYLKETKEYVRPIVNQLYGDAWDIFDRHLYEKAGLVLHQLHKELGEELFIKAIQHYARKHKASNADTHDFQRAVAEATGREYDRFFEQWFYRAGHPELSVSTDWDKESLLASLSVTQKQAEMYDFKVKVVFSVQETLYSFPIRISKQNETFYFPLPSAPEMVRFSEGGLVLGIVEFNKSTEMWIYQLLHDKDALGRSMAAQGLSNKKERKAVSALNESLKSDQFYGVKVEAATALGEIGTDQARESLLAALDKEEEPRVRRSIVCSLGRFKDKDVSKALLDLLKRGDKSYFVEGEAALSLAKTKSEEAYDVLQEVLKKPSFLETIRSNALAGLAELGDERAVPVVTEYIKPQYSNRLRSAAASVLACLGKSKKEKVSEILKDLLEATSPNLRQATVEALMELSPSNLVSILSDRLSRELDPRVLRCIRKNLQSIAKSKDAKEQVSILHKEIDKLKDENRKLYDRITKLETLHSQK